MVKEEEKEPNIIYNRKRVNELKHARSVFLRKPKIRSLEYISPKSPSKAREVSGYDGD